VASTSGYKPFEQELAKRVIAQVAPDETEGFLGLVRFLNSYPEFASSRRGKNGPIPGTRAYAEDLALRFVRGRVPRRPEPPATVPDPVVGVVLEKYFEVPASRVRNVVREHQLAMASENIIGTILEHYIASVLEPMGWLWCSGETVRSIDFVRPPASAGEQWILLQVKNRDNSENSSSAKVRDGTSITKWFRTFSRPRNPQTNWAAFPHASSRTRLSEDGFLQFAVKYLRTADSADS
jgi:SinI restriction endonuclease